MYIKVIRDTLNVALYRPYTKWAVSVQSGEYKFAGYTLFSDSSDIIDATVNARTIYTYFNENFVIIGHGKAGDLALDFSGNLYNCGKTFKRLDVTFDDFLKRTT